MAKRLWRRGKIIKTESTLQNVNQSHSTETAEEEVEGGVELKAMEYEDMSNFENQNPEDQIGFKHLEGLALWR